MSTLTYARLVDELFPRLGGGIRWGLERTSRLLAAVGDPHLSYPTIHVGGTNGKGSAAATIASILRARGLRVGLYTSPHLCSFRERIQIDGEPIGEVALLAAASRLWPLIQGEGASFFEATTAIGFLALADADVEIAVIEVGLGGRLDSTNVIRPLVSVLTNVSLDHVQLLGPTLEHVATEKAGILKPGVPAVFGGVEDAAGAVIRAAAQQVGAPLHVLRRDDVARIEMDLHGTSFSYATAGGPAEGGDTQGYTLRTPLVGTHQALNAALAVEAVRRLPARFRPTDPEIEAGVAAVRWPGRLQVERIAGRTWVFDVAHNVAGVYALLDALEGLGLGSPRTVLVGVLGDKDWAGMLVPLHRWADRLVLSTPPTAPAERLWDVQRAAGGLPGRGAGVEVIADFEAALRSMAQPGEGVVVVTGSFHTVGDALAMLGRCACEADAHLPLIDFPG